MVKIKQTFAFFQRCQKNLLKIRQTIKNCNNFVMTLFYWRNALLVLKTVLDVLDRDVRIENCPPPQTTVKYVLEMS